MPSRDYQSLVDLRAMEPACHASRVASVFQIYVQIRPSITNSASNTDHETVLLAMFMCSIQTTFLNITAFNTNIRKDYQARILTSECPRFNTVEAVLTSSE